MRAPPAVPASCIAGVDLPCRDQSPTRRWRWWPAGRRHRLLPKKAHADRGAPFSRCAVPRHARKGRAEARRTEWIARWPPAVGDGHDGVVPRIQQHRGRPSAWPLRPGARADLPKRQRGDRRVKRDVQIGSRQRTVPHSPGGARRHGVYLSVDRISAGRLAAAARCQRNAFRGLFHGVLLLASADSRAALFRRATRGEGVDGLQVTASIGHAAPAGQGRDTG